MWFSWFFFFFKLLCKVDVAAALTVAQTPDCYVSPRIFLFPFFVRSLQVHVCLFKIKSAFSVTACVVAFFEALSAFSFWCISHTFSFCSFVFFVVSASCCMFSCFIICAVQLCTLEWACLVLSNFVSFYTQSIWWHWRFLKFRTN